MKNNEQLTTVELMDIIAMSLREMNGMEISNRNLPNAINRAKANAMLSQAALKLAVFDARNSVDSKATRVLKKAEGQKSVKLIK